MREDGARAGTGNVHPAAHTRGAGAADSGRKAEAGAGAGGKEPDTARAGQQTGRMGQAAQRPRAGRTKRGNTGEDGESAERGQGYEG